MTPTAGAVARLAMKDPVGQRHLIGVAPGGVGNAGLLRPASGCIPSGGAAKPVAATIGAGAGATLSEPSPL
jgi:hypothetical protein